MAEKADKPVEVVLASRSPRRRELMARITAAFRVYPVDVDESSVTETDPVKFAIKAAILKAKAAAESFPEAIVIGADTVVAVERYILGKPDGRASARAMLERLSGRRHRVITGVALYRKSEERLMAGSELTYVTFRPLTEEMIEAYLDKGEYVDKAGAYAVQDIGDAFVAHLKGDYDNVVGFPVKKVADMLARFRAPTVRVDVEDVNFPGNEGVARSGGRKLLIPGAVIGDAVRVQIVRDRVDAAVAEIVRVERSSPFRVEPVCPHFGSCGGCVFQSTDYQKQLEIKSRRLERILGEAGVFEGGNGHLRDVVPSPEIYGYRNKMEFGFGEEGGDLVIGLRQRGQNLRKSRSRTVALAQCPILGPFVESLFPTVLQFARSQGLGPHNTRTGQGVLRHLVVREGKRTGDLMILVVTAPAPEVDFLPLADALARRLPRLKSFYRVVNSRVCDLVNFGDKHVVLGDPWIEERLGGLAFRIYPETFFQTNTAAAERLYEALGKEAGLSPTSRVLGLYCGSGAIEIGLSRLVAEVTGIDLSVENIRNAVENAAINGIANCVFMNGAVETLPRNSAEPAPDLLILDPPRAGISPVAMKHVSTIETPTIAYVSCNPASLVRDVKKFMARGYRVATITPFDFFPHTPLIETLTILRQGADSRERPTLVRRSDSEPHQREMS